MSYDSGRLVTGMGLVCAVGGDAVTAAAAQRAGIVRRQPIAEVKVFDESELEAPLVAAPVLGGSGGFTQSGAWIRLADAALTDLVTSAQLPPASDVRFWQETGLAWVLPEIDDERFGWPPSEIPTLLDRWATQVLVDVTGLQLLRPAIFAPMGSAGMAAVLGQLPAIFRRQVRRVLIVAVESWLDAHSLNWLGQRDRLKGAEMPVGLCPGEAGACLLLELPDAARTRKADAAATILSAAIEAPPPASASEDFRESRHEWAPALAVNLSRAIEEALRSAGRALPFRGDIYVDLNGETWKSEVWGQAQVRLQGAIDFDRTRTRFPAIELGDVGAASAAVSLCLAARSFARGYATGTEALICSISDSGHTGAIVIGGS
jgi:3-oxoacyl-[acyl-carrier-protein] synthase-1